MYTTYEELAADLLEELAAPQAKIQRIERGIERNVRYFLRNYNFPESLTLLTTPALTEGDDRVELPALAGKIKAVRILLDTEDPPLYKRIFRREEGVLPHHEGPAVYYREGSDLVLDTALPEDGYKLQIWYQTLDKDVVESWLLPRYGDALFHRCVYEMASGFRKPEVQQVYAGLWQDDQVVLAIFLQELEFGDMQMNMGQADLSFIEERYRSGYPHGS